MRRSERPFTPRTTGLFPKAVAFMGYRAICWRPFPLSPRVGKTISKQASIKREREGLLGGPFSYSILFFLTYEWIVVPSKEECSRRKREREKIGTWEFEKKEREVDGKNVPFPRNVPRLELSIIVPPNRGTSTVLEKNRVCGASLRCDLCETLQS